MSLPHPALLQIILDLAPEDLYWYWTGQYPENLGLLEASKENIRLLLGKKYTIHSLCAKHKIKESDTMEAFLWEWDFWHLDLCKSPQYFLKRYKETISEERALFLAGRNARENEKWLSIINHILDVESLWCSREHIINVCNGLFWSPKLQKEYIRPLENYHKTQNPTIWKYDLSDLFGETEKPEGTERFAFMELDYNELLQKNLLETDIISRGEKISQATLNNDLRVLICLDPTKEEIEFNHDAGFWTDYSAEKMKYYHKTGVDKSKLKNHCYTEWYELLENNTFKICGVDYYSDGEESFEGDWFTFGQNLSHESFYFDLLKEYFARGNPVFPEAHHTLSVLCDKQLPYKPQYIKWFFEKIGREICQERPEIIALLERKIEGDPQMMEWYSAIF